jgi:hypothetical protein
MEWLMAAATTAEAMPLYDYDTDRYWLLFVTSDVEEGTPSG